MSSPGESFPELAAIVRAAIERATVTVRRQTANVVDYVFVHDGHEIGSVREYRANGTVRTNVRVHTGNGYRWYTWPPRLIYVAITQEYALITQSLANPDAPESPSIRTRHGLV